MNKMQKNDNQFEVDQKVSVALINCTASILNSYLQNHSLSKEEMLSFIDNIYINLKSKVNLDLHENQHINIRKQQQMLQKQTVFDEYIICLEDGKKLKTLKRYLNSHFNLKPEEYIKKWNLPFNYPMTAPSYQRKRSYLAKKSGLGKKEHREKINS